MTIKLQNGFRSVNRDLKYKRDIHIFNNILDFGLHLSPILDNNLIISQG